MDTYLQVGYSSEKSEVIPNSSLRGKAFALEEGSASYQLVGGVKAYQGDDG